MPVEAMGTKMRRTTDTRNEFYHNPLPISDETYWTAAQLRVVKRLLQLEWNAKPEERANPTWLISRMAHSLTYLPHMGMYQFWLQALSLREPSQTVSEKLSDMYADACKGYTFRRVAFDGYKANRRAH